MSPKRERGGQLGAEGEPRRPGADGDAKGVAARWGTPVDPPFLPRDSGDPERLKDILEKMLCVSGLLGCAEDSLEVREPDRREASRVGPFVSLESLDSLIAREQRLC